MGKEILVIPEDYLAKVIEVIRAGLKSIKDIDPVVEHALIKWCKEEEEYLERLGEKENE